MACKLLEQITHFSRKEQKQTERYLKEDHSQSNGHVPSQHHSNFDGECRDMAPMLIIVIHQQIVMNLLKP